jgi:hypothetical protein
MGFLGRLWHGEGWAVHDARGRWMHLYDPFERLSGAADGHGLTDEEFRRVQDLMLGRGPGARPGAALLVCAWIALLTIMAVLRVRATRRLPEMEMLWLAMTGLAIWFSRRARVPLKPASFARAMLTIGRCPACAYPLRPADPATGTTVCTECGGVWAGMGTGR